MKRQETRLVKLEKRFSETDETEHGLRFCSLIISNPYGCSLLDPFRKPFIEKRLQEEFLKKPSLAGLFDYLQNLANPPEIVDLYPCSETAEEVARKIIDGFEEHGRSMTFWQCDRCKYMWPSWIDSCLFEQEFRELHADSSQKSPKQRKHTRNRKSIGGSGKRYCG